MNGKDPFGLGRVVGEVGVLPQRAQRLDPSLPLRPDELLIRVEHLNVDAASFLQLKNEAGGDPHRIAEAIRQIVSQRGKLHNPVTGSGGMLIGRVQQIGSDHPSHGTLQIGDRVATLVSLTLTPLHLEQVRAVHVANERVDVNGHAILFASGLYAKLPADLSETLALAVLDVCGAPALVARHARPGMTVAVIGAGKSGALCLAQARRSLRGEGTIIAIDRSPEPLASLASMGLCDVQIAADATQAVRLLEQVASATEGTLCDLVVNCASVPGTEMATILCTKQRGTAVFFSMATSFTAAALGAEGAGKDVTMLIGNGYAEGHADLALELLRSEFALRRVFEQRFG